MPLHTFLPSPTEVLLLLLPMSVVAVMAMVIVLLATSMMFYQVSLSVAVIVVMLFLQSLVLMFKHCVVSGSLLKHMLPLCLGVPFSLIEDVWLMTEGRCEVLHLRQAV